MTSVGWLSVAGFPGRWKFVGAAEVAKVSKLGLTFQVTGVKKPLMSVSKVVEKGNRVCFGPQVKDNFIENIETKRRFPLVSNGKRSYLLNVDFENGKQTSITIYSGAEDSVCPKDWGGGIRLDGGSEDFVQGCFRK